MGVSLAFLSCGLLLGRGRLLTARIGGPLAAGVMGLCLRQDQMPSLRWPFFIQAPPIGPEDLRELRL